MRLVDGWCHLEIDEQSISGLPEIVPLGEFPAEELSDRVLYRHAAMNGTIEPRDDLPANEATRQNLERRFIEHMIETVKIFRGEELEDEGTGFVR